MLQAWTRQGEDGIRVAVKNAKTLALHVLTYAGFGTQYSFTKGVQAHQENHTMTYRDALITISDNILVIFLIPRRYMSLRMLPNSIRQVGYALQEFKQYMGEMLDQERMTITNRDDSSGNLMGALIRASEEAKHSSTSASGVHRDFLTDDEIFGNIFIYNLAGHETTANTISYAILLMAATPELQDWIRKEARAVLEPGYENSEAWRYECSFPKLKRCLAVMVS